uniref:DNA/RNA non-specific endonuclease domain-containing protein n=1 Tax=Bactrocera dorsalis TaxID=27457 RepID=A0A034WRJ0_BACDO
MQASFIWTLLIVVVVLIICVLYVWLNQTAANFNKNSTNGQINSIANGPINSFDSANSNLPVETIIKSLDKYDEVPFSPCGIKVNGDMLNNSPILTPHNQLEYLLPNSSGEIVVPHGQWVSLRCGDAFAKPFGAQTLQAQCAGDTNFRINNQIVNFSNINCTTMSMPISMRTGLCCSGKDTELIDIGNKFNESLLPTMQVCFDQIRQTTLYVEHKITPASIHYRKHVPRKNFTSDDFFGGRNIDPLYRTSKQIKALKRILGKDVSIYVTAKNYLSRGHLVAKADLIFSGQQKSTFYYVNIVPQWQSFNAGNWSRIEDGVRQFAHDSNSTLLCWTGTWGVCTLPDVNNEQRELYLGDDKQNNNVIPVPKLFYRIVIDAESRKGITFVGVNNPYLKIEELTTGGYLIAEDVSDNIDWIKWDRKNIEKGYCYACSVPDFVAVVKDLPLVKLMTSGILGLKELPI